jgi:hypothetical protein
VAKPVEQHQPEESVQLKDRQLAAFLAWLVPGLGHLYQGRTAKAVLFFVCIMGTFIYGVYLGSSNEPINPKDPDSPPLGWGRVVYFSWEENNKRLWYLGQIGVGLPAMPALIQAWRMGKNMPVWWHGFMAPPRSSSPPANDANAAQPTSHDLGLKLSRYFELGTVYTTIAGLLNVLAIYDAWGGPVLGETAKKEEEDEAADGARKPGGVPAGEKT